MRLSVGCRGRPPGAHAKPQAAEEIPNPMPPGPILLSYKGRLAWGVLITVFAVDPEWTHWSSLDLLEVLLVPALVLINGLFVAAEFALVAVRRTRVEELVHQGVRGAKAVEEAITHLDRTIAATQLGITLASIGLGLSASRPWPSCSSRCSRPAPAWSRVGHPFRRRHPGPLPDHVHARRLRRADPQDARAANARSHGLCGWPGR